MNLALVVKILTIIAENAGAVPELVSLYQELVALITGHHEQGTIPADEAIQNLADRFKVVHDKLAT